MGILDFEMSELLLSRIFFGSCFRKLNAMHRRVCTTGLHVINNVYEHWIPMNKNSIAPCSFCMSRVVFRGPWVERQKKRQGLKAARDTWLARAREKPGNTRAIHIAARFQNKMDRDKIEQEKKEG